MTDVAEFLARHAKPYDPATDSYRRPPFAAPVKAGKNTAIYNAHSYHTKVPPQGIVPYIEHYTEPGDLVLDPFCGSGMTGIAAMMIGRAAFLNDLSPAAVHIARNYCAPIDVQELRQEYERIKASMTDEFAWLYGTTCDRCGGPATIQYTIWSQALECCRCGGPLVLWNVAVNHETGSVRKSFSCPTCGKKQRKAEAAYVQTVPVVTNYECSRCSPSRSEHRTTELEKRRIAEVDSARLQYWHPTMEFDDSWEMWRGEHAELGITNVSRFFTKRNLWALARVRHEVMARAGQPSFHHLFFAFTASVLNATKMYKYRSDRKGGILSGTLYVPALNCELNVGNVFERKLKAVSWSIHGDVACVTGSASTLDPLSGNSVDYVFTDPPFGSNIFYADCNLIWEAWLDQGFTDQSQEAVVHVKHKDKNTMPDYARLMTESFQEMHRVLKPGRWASVVFHNSDERIWQIILDAAETAGFELAEINSFDKEQLSFKGIRGAKGLERVTNKDIVLNLHKARAAPTIREFSVNGTGRLARGNGDSEIRIIERIAEYLAGNPAPESRTLQALWNTALGEMIRSGVVEASMEDVGIMLPHYFKEVDGRWYLRGEAVLGGNVFDVTSDAGAIAWLTALLAEPRTTGELIPEWQKITAQAGGMAPGRLERLLQENFWLDQRTGRWRVPSQAERDRMSAQESLRDQAHLRVVRRFLAGRLPQPPNPRELAAWVQFCYGRQAYEEAAQLFSLVDPSSIEEEWYGKLRRLVAVCRARAEGTNGEGE